MLQFLKNEKGISLIQVMIAGSVLIGVGTYVTQNIRSQEKISKSARLRSETNQQVVEISEALTNWETCRSTLSKSGALTGSTIDAVTDKDDHIIYRRGNEMKGGEIGDMKLLDYTSASGLRHTKAKLRITMKFNDKRSGNSGAYGGTQKNFDIPIYLITKDNTVQTCMSDEAEVVEETLRIACAQFGGTYNSTTGACENLHGPDGVVLKFIKDYFCSATGAGCQHPYAGQSCSGTDVRGIDRGNWVVSGFGGSGDMQCSCMPIKCPNPAPYCIGTDLGTDWCKVECPKGTWQPDDYGPDPSGVCEGESFSQSNSCGQTRSATGTKDCTP